MNLTDYPGIFDARGAAYEAAMRRWPDARASEFEALFTDSPVRTGEQVLDVPAGGGYLAQRIPQARVTSLEFSTGFDRQATVVEPLGAWPVARFDRVVCLAALHHIASQDAFLRRLTRHLLPGGRLHVADVPEGSGVARLLDGFIARHNGTGHKGRYLSRDARRFEALGTVLRHEEIECGWRFPHDDAMLDFCAGLFGLKDFSRARLLVELEREVGVTRTAGATRLAWRLLYTDVVRA